MAKQYRVKRRIAQAIVSENGQLSVDVPRGYDIESLGFRLYGSIVVATGATSVRAEAPCQLIKRIELISDGKNTIASVPLVLLNRANVWRKQLGSLTPPTAATAATYPIEATGMLDQQLIDGLRPKDSNLRTKFMSQLQVRFTFGAAIDCFVPGAGVASLSGVYCDIFAYEMVELPDENGQITNPLYVVKRSFQDIAFTASNANMEIILPVGNVMRGVVIRAEGAVTAGEPSDAVINNIQLASNTDVRFNLPYLDARAGNKQDYDMTTLPTGIVAADLMSGGQQSVRALEGWDLTQASQAKLILDVTGATNTRVTVMTVELLRAA